MFDAAITNSVLNSAVFDAILFIWGLGRSICAYVNHITRFYLRKDSFTVYFLFFYVASTYECFTCTELLF